MVFRRLFGFEVLPAVLIANVQRVAVEFAVTAGRIAESANAKSRAVCAALRTRYDVVLVRGWPTAKHAIRRVNRWR